MFVLCDVNRLRECVAREARESVCVGLTRRKLHGNGVRFQARRGGGEWKFYNYIDTRRSWRSLAGRRKGGRSRWRSVLPLACNRSSLPPPSLPPTLSPSSGVRRGDSCLSWVHARTRGSSYQTRPRLTRIRTSYLPTYFRGKL